MTVRQLLDINELLCEILLKKQDDFNAYKDNGDGYSDYLKIAKEDAEKKYNQFLKMEVVIK